MASAQPLRGSSPSCWHPVAILHALWGRRDVILQLARREIEMTYRGSLLGLVWIVVQPLILLGVYALVFLGVFRRPGSGLEDVQYVLGMFLGILLYSFFADNATRAPQLVLSNPSYVKRVVFPLEVLPVSVLLALLLNLGIGLMLLLAADLVLLGGVPLSFVVLPLLLVPLLLLTLGSAWFLASLGVFLRDIPQIVRAVTLVLMFLTPIFWDLEMLPPEHRHWVLLNPLAAIVVPAKQALVFGAWPDPWLLVLVTLFAAFFAVAGHAWFAKTRHGFADVL